MTDKKSNQTSNDKRMSDDEAAALLASLRTLKPKNNDCNVKDPRLNKKEKNKNKRKRSFSQMQNEQSDVENEDKKEKIELIPKKIKKNSPFNPLKNIDWKSTPFIFVRLTYFNKRKSRKFPSFIDDYGTFKNFVEFYFSSLINCKWHCQFDEDWIENIDDFNAIRDKYLSTNENIRDFFLELIIINESLPIKCIYAPKAVYVDNPYTCSYPPQSSSSSSSSSSMSLLSSSSSSSQQTAHPKYHNAPIQPPPPSHPTHSYPAYNYQSASYPASSYHAVPVHSSPPKPKPEPEPVNNVEHSNPNKSSSNDSYTHVTYPHYLQRVKKTKLSSSGGTTFDGVVCPDPTKYLPFSHAGQSTPQMRTLHKIVWVLQHQSKPLTVDLIRSCLPGKKKAAINEIDYLLSSYEKYEYTQSIMINNRKSWQLKSGAFPPEFWNMQWQRRG